MKKFFAVVSVGVLTLSLNGVIGSTAQADSTKTKIEFMGLSKDNRYIVSGNAAAKNVILAKFDSARVVLNNHTVVIAPKQKILGTLKKAGVNLGKVSVYPDTFIESPQPDRLEALENVTSIKKDVSKIDVLQANALPALPSDLGLELQWSLFPNSDWLEQGEASVMHGIDAFGAWGLFDETLPGEGVNVTIIDTGYTVHPELAVADSADFTSEDNSNDGDGWDNDGADTGDFCGDYSSSWHGTHVHGTIAADINNGVVAGVAPYANVVHARALGTCGGWSSDIAAAILWSAGASWEEDYGIEDNEFPADIINMSLGGFGMCDPLYQDVINYARALGSLIVVSAGNSYDVSTMFAPASCDGVITVVSTGPSGDRAYYSNYGIDTEISAPGGDWCDTKFSQWAFGDFEDCYESYYYWLSFEYVDTNMILSTLNTGLEGPGDPAYAWYQGTSMAAPHVVGAAALALSANPDLNIEQLEEILLDSTSGFSNHSYEGYRVDLVRGVDDYSCNLHEFMCGSGIVNAYNAVSLALETEGSDGSRVSRIVVDVAANAVDGQVTTNFFLSAFPGYWGALTHVDVWLANASGKWLTKCRVKTSVVNSFSDSMSCTFKKLSNGRSYWLAYVPYYGREIGEVVYRDFKLARTPSTPVIEQINVTKWVDLDYGMFNGIAEIFWSASSAPDMTYGHTDYVAYYVEAYSEEYGEVWYYCGTYANECTIPYLIPGDRFKFRVVAITTRGQTSSSWSKWYKVPQS